MWWWTSQYIFQSLEFHRLDWENYRNSMPEKQLFIAHNGDWRNNDWIRILFEIKLFLVKIKTYSNTQKQAAFYVFYFEELNIATEMGNRFSLKTAQARTLIDTWTVEKLKPKPKIGDFIYSQVFGTYGEEEWNIITPISNRTDTDTTI